MPQEKSRKLVVGLLLGTALLVTLLAYLGAHFVFDKSMAPLLDNLHWTVAMMASAAMAWIGLQGASPDNRPARFWFLSGLIGVTLGQIAWDLQMAFDWNPFPAPSDALYLSLGFSLIAAMASELAKNLGRPQFKVMLLDTTMLVMPLVALSLVIYLPRSHTVSTFGFLVMAAYPTVMYAAGCLGLMVLLYLRPRFSWAWVLAVVSILVEGPLWMHWSTVTLYDHFEFGTLFNTTFSITTPLMALGAMYWHITPSGTPRYRLQCEAILRMLPLFSVAVATLSVFLTSSNEVIPSMRVAVQTAAMIVIIAAALRQRLQLAEHERLQQAESALIQSEIQFRSLIDASPVPYALSDSSGNVIYLNAAFTRTFGYTQQDVPTMLHWGELAYPDQEERERVKQHWLDYWANSVRRPGMLSPMELNVRCRNGDTKTVIAGGASLTGRHEGHKLYVLQDITDRKRIEAAEKQNTERYRSLTELAPFPTVMISLEGTLIYGNQRARELFNIASNTVAGTSTLDFYVNPEQRDEIIRALETRGSMYDYELELRTPDGRHFPALVSTQLVNIEGQSLIISCINDISARKRAEIELEQSARRFHELIETVAIPIVVSDLDSGSILYANGRAERLFKAAHGAGHPTSDYYGDPAIRQSVLERIRSGEAIVDLEIQMRRADDSLFWALISVIPMTFDGKRALITSVNDIDDRKKAEAILQDSAKRYRSLIDASPFPIVVTELASGVLLYANHRAEGLFGGNISQHKGQMTSDFFLDPALNLEQRTKGLQALQEGAEIYEYEAQLRSLDGYTFWAILSLALIDFDGQSSLMTSISDITTHKLAAETLQQSALRYRNMIEAAPFPVVVADIETGTVLYCNERAANLFNVDKDAAIGLSTRDAYVDPGMREIVLTSISEGRTLLDHEVRLQDWHGRQFWALISVSRIEFDGKPALLTSINDITDRKLASLAVQDNERKLNSILDNLTSYIYLKDTEGRYVYVNRMVCELWNKSLDEVVGRTDEDFFDRETVAKIRDTDRRVLVQGESVRLEESNLNLVDGRCTTYWSIKLPLRDQENRIYGLVGISTDITERKEVEEKLQLSARVFSEAHEGILITDAEGLIIDVNPTFSEITGYSREEAIGQKPNMLKSGKQGNDFYSAMWLDLDKQGFWQGELWNRRKDGSLYAELLSISALRDNQGQIRHYIALFSDITQSKHQQQRLELLAHYDSLTHLPNRMLFSDRFNQAIARCKREPSNMLAVCYLDLDGFKQVNDTLGHDAGDTLLVQVAERIKSMLREEDTVSRLGGDEFAMLLGDIRSIDQCQQAMDRIHHAIAQPYLLGNESVVIGASSGVALYPQDNSDPDTLLRHADQAMYQAKLAGRNRHQMFDAAHDQQVQQHRLRLEAIETAFALNQFVLYYQPKVNMKTGAVFGAEALIRWIDPERGMIAPYEFLPVLENTPFEITLGDWVIEQAMQQLDRWNAQGLDLQVSVNIAPRHLQDKHFFSALEAALARHPKVLSQQFEIEVLESGMVEDMAAVSEVLSACRELLGISIALDDFGTGYSSLTHLRHLPANMIKIDQSFVRDMIEDPDDFAIIEGVVGLAGAFSRGVIAEGVETREQGTMLLMLGCTLAQGYALARPMPADDLGAWIAQYQPDQAWIEFASHPLLPHLGMLLLIELENQQWYKRMETCLSTPPGTLTHWPIMRAKSCHCGRWLVRAVKEGHFPQDVLDAVTHDHEELHRIGNVLMHQYQDGQPEVARAGLPQLKALQKNISRQLHSLGL